MWVGCNDMLGLIIDTVLEKELRSKGPIRGIGGIGSL
jgi:hypothetical protein